jgi:putative nucleotidyltransferase with HDIG domain
MTWYNPVLFAASATLASPASRWLDITVWGGVLMLTGYSMGTLYEHKTAQVAELQDTYHGVLMILRHFIAKDTYTENHSYRVSIYAAKIAASMGLAHARIEDVRSAALLHDIGKLDISRELLYKAARLTSSEYEQMKEHVQKGVDLLEPVGGSLRRVIPIILAHHDKFDGSGYHPTSGMEIPIEARIISVADVYDSLTSDRPYRRAMSTFDAKDVIVKGSGTDFDPKVVNAFNDAFRRGELEVPTVVV